MKNLLLVSGLIFFLQPLHLLAQSTNGQGQSNGRENWFPNRGNVGIGTRTPSEALEVLGSVRVSQTVFTNDLETVGLKATSLTVSDNASVGKNLLVGGNVGIGILNPQERLEISGNLKVSGGIFGDELTVRKFTASEIGSVNNTLTVGQKFLVNGVTGLGVSNPTERLEVSGNVKVSNSVTADQLNVRQFTASESGNVGTNFTIGQKLIVNGSSGLGVSSPTERLEVAGNVKVTNGLFSDFINSGDGSFSRNLQVSKNILVEGMTGLGVAAPSERLEVLGNVKISEGLFSKTIQSVDANLTGAVQVNGNIISNSRIGIGISSPSEALDVLGNIKSSADMVAVNVRADKGYFKGLESTGGLQITGNVGIGVANPVEKLEVSGNIKATQSLLSTDANISNDLLVGGNTSVTGNVGIGTTAGTEKLRVAGNSYFNGLITAENLTVKQSLDLKGSFLLGGNLGIGVSSPEAPLHVNGDGKFDGDIRANKIIVNAIEIAGATQGPGGGSSVSLGDNLFVNGSVGIGTTKTAGYRLSVDGKIRAADDIKVYSSTEWSDFVFEKTYVLRPLADVQAFINEHGHLPEIPSAKQVKRDGVDLVAMDAKLLQKIEELTLYVIELKKMDDTLREENELLKREVKSLRSSVKK